MEFTFSTAGFSFDAPVTDTAQPAFSFQTNSDPPAAADGGAAATTASGASAVPTDAISSERANAFDASSLFGAAAGSGTSSSSGNSMFGALPTAASFGFFGDATAAPTAAVATDAKTAGPASPTTDFSMSMFDVGSTITALMGQMTTPDAAAALAAAAAAGASTTTDAPIGRKRHGGGFVAATKAVDTNSEWFVKTLEAILPAYSDEGVKALSLAAARVLFADELDQMARVDADTAVHVGSAAMKKQKALLQGSGAGRALAPVSERLKSFSIRRERLVSAFVLPYTEGVLGVARLIAAYAINPVSELMTSSPSPPAVIAPTAAVAAAGDGVVGDAFWTGPFSAAAQLPAEKRVALCWYRCVPARQSWAVADVDAAPLPVHGDASAAAASAAPPAAAAQESTAAHTAAAKPAVPKEFSAFPFGDARRMATSASGSAEPLTDEQMSRWFVNAQLPPLAGSNSNSGRSDAAAGAVEDCVVTYNRERRWLELVVLSTGERRVVVCLNPHTAEPRGITAVCAEPVSGGLLFTTRGALYRVLGGVVTLLAGRDDDRLAMWATDVAGAPDATGIDARFGVLVGVIASPPSAEAWRVAGGEVAEFVAATPAAQARAAARGRTARTTRIVLCDQLKGLHVVELSTDPHALHPLGTAADVWVQPMGTRMPRGSAHPSGAVFDPYASPPCSAVYAACGSRVVYIDLLTGLSILLSTGHRFETARLVLAPVAAAPTGPRDAPFATAHYSPLMGSPAAATAGAYDWRLMVLDPKATPFAMDIRPHEYWVSDTDTFNLAPTMVARVQVSRGRAIAGAIAGQTVDTVEPAVRAATDSDDTYLPVLNSASNASLKHWVWERQERLEKSWQFASHTPPAHELALFADHTAAADQIYKCMAIASLDAHDRCPWRGEEWVHPTDLTATPTLDLDTLVADERKAWSGATVDLTNPLANALYTVSSNSADVTRHVLPLQMPSAYELWNSTPKNVDGRV